MIGEYLRLAFATAVVLLPGFLIARALGQKTASAALAWAFAVLFVAWGVVFTAHGTIKLAAAILAGTGIVAGIFAVRGLTEPVAIAPEHEGPDPVIWGRRAVALAGIVFGLVLWHVEGAVTGDALFHEARVRKLVELGHLHLRSVDELVHGGLHPGYAFPLWHGFLALVTKVSGLDPSVVLHREASVLAPLAFVVAWEAGVAVFDSVTGGVSVLAASVALYALAAGHGGSYVSLALPATASRQILVLAAIALFFTYAESGRWTDLGALAAAFGAVVLVHPTYALFTLIALVAYSLLRWRDWKRSALALAAAVVPVGITVLWLRPVIDETLSVNPSDQLQAATLAKYGGELVVYSVHRFRLAAEVPGRTGAVAIAALALVPLAGFAAKRRWGAYVLGGAVAILALMLIPELFTRFSNAVSLSQSRRAAGFLPFAFAFAGGLALLARSVWVLPFALAAGIVLERQWPGDFAYGLRNGGPGAVTWFALVGGAIALVVGIVAARNRPKERYGLGALAALLFVLPVAVHGFKQWSPLNTTDSNALSPGLLASVKKLPDGAVVIADPETSYRIAAAAPVYLVAAPIAHVANTKANDPAARVADVERWLKTGDPAIPRRYGAGWAVVHGRLVRLPS
jgi:hypothetical protein